jgi:hypothetical protein
MTNDFIILYNSIAIEQWTFKFILKKTCQDHDVLTGFYFVFAECEAVNNDEFT